jgi:selenocysteine lyase/cysteine desulfurase
MDPADLRADIPALSECAFLNTGASGPSPRRVVDAVTRFNEHHKFAAPCGEGMYDAASEQRESARAAAAGLLGADPTEIALTRSTVEGVNIVANAIDWEPGDVVVHPDFEHPAGDLPWVHLADRAGIENRVLPTERGRLDLDALAEAVADARLLCISSLTWNYGTRIPVERVVDIAHDAGARVLVDAVQAPGQMPVDVGSWGADFVAASGHKWLMGPWGSGMLYVDGDVLADLDPARIGYFSVADAMADYCDFHPDARRFELGTTAIGPYAGLETAIETVQAVGFDTVQSRIERLTDRLKAGLGDRLLSPRDYESGLVTFAADDPEATVSRLADAGVRIRAIPEPAACRASVHVFNTAEDVDRLLEGL